MTQSLEVLFEDAAVRYLVLGSTVALKGTVCSLDVPKLVVRKADLFHK